MTAALPTKARTYFDQRINCETVFVLPGHHYVQSSGVGAICTLLGSCVAACICDPDRSIGGLNHFLLPEGSALQSNVNNARYGVYAMELLINDLIKNGAQKSRLVAKVFGGANVISSAVAGSIGAQNGKFVKSYLQSESIPVLAEDLGGDKARRVYFFPSTGRVSVLALTSSINFELERKERLLQERATETAKGGGVELF